MHNINEGNYKLEGMVLNIPQLVVTQQLVTDIEGALEHKVIKGNYLLDEDMK